MADRLFIIDAYAQIYRSYYAFLKSPRINSKGENTSAVFGFINILEEIIRKEKPTHLAVAFDPHGPTFRHEAYEAYKAQREATPEVIHWSVPFIKEIVAAYGIPCLEVEGFEADDVAGTLSKIAVEKGFDVFMVTPDKDYGQLVGPHAFLYKPRFGSSDYDVLGEKEVCEKYGVGSPAQIIDLLALMGDSSDNIPGCPGIGKVYAQKLVGQFQSVENLLEHTDELSGAIKTKVENGKDMIRFSKFLATIRTDVPLHFDGEAMRVHARNKDRLAEIYQRLEFRSLLSRQSAADAYPPQTSAKPTDQAWVRSTDSRADKSATAGGAEVATFDSNLTGSPKTGTGKPSRSAGMTKPETQGQLSLWDDEEALENAPDTTQTTGAVEYAPLKGICEAEGNTQTTDNDIVNLENSGVFRQASLLAIQLKQGPSANNSPFVEGISWSDDQGHAGFVSLAPNDPAMSALKELIETPGLLKVGYDLKKQWLDLDALGWRLAGPYFDIRIAHYLLQPELPHYLDYIGNTYLEGEPAPPSQAASTGQPARWLAKLYPPMKAALERDHLTYLSEEVEMPLIEVLADMEKTGLNLDIDALKDFADLLKGRMADLQNDIFGMAGKEFNLNSSQQVGQVLFDDLHLSEKAKKTKGSKHYSTSEEVLTELLDKHPIVGKILDYRGMKKLLSTYVESFPSLVNPKTGRLHTTFNQTVAATGRLSSSNPNLQNIPVRDALGKEMRKVFTAGDGEVFLSADYSQVELRLMAHLSQDQQMIADFLEDSDIHRATAAKVFHVAPEDVTSDMRRKAKTANFGIIYGISSFGLAQRMDVSRTEAKQLIDEYFETYRGIKDYMDRVVAEARETQMVETLYHRRRYLPDIVSHNATVRALSERNAINAPIQGTAADIIKIAMLGVWRRLHREGLKARMILQVHDELNFIVPREEVEQVSRLVREEMEQVAQLSVPLKVDIGTGRNWLEAH